jgi:cell filamentation protein
MPELNDNLYDYCYDSDDPYVYEGTNTLVNRFGLIDSRELSQAERAITGVATAYLEANPIRGNYDLDHLKAIHRKLFEEIYGWAGRTRKKGFISKGSSLFCAAEYIEPYAVDLFQKLKTEKYLQDLDLETFAERMAFYIAEINALHPFREGNGRTQRIFINQLARQAGWELNLSAVSPDALLDAMIASMTDTSPLVKLLRETITVPTL